MHFPPFAPVLLAWMIATAAPAQTVAISATLPAGTVVPLVTITELSSKNEVTGDKVRLKIAEDVRVAGQTLLVEGTQVVGEIAAARAASSMGRTGMIAVAPLYAEVGDVIVRLDGQAAAERTNQNDTNALMWLISPIISGHSASIPAGTRINAVVLRSVTLPVVAGR